MKERPILFSGPMVRAILEGRKTQTRRVCKLTPPSATCPPCPYGQPGDRLWVRETWKTCRMPLGYSAEYGVAYAADGKRLPVPSHIPVEYGAPWNIDAPWRPSIYMPRWATRITLDVVAVRVERLQDISGKDAMAEGVEMCDVPGHDDCIYGVSGQGYRCAFERLWDSINAARGFGWSVNPWVWVVEFRRVQP